MVITVPCAQPWRGQDRGEVEVGTLAKAMAPGTATPVKSLLHWQLAALGAGVETPGASVMLCWHQPFGYA